MDGSAPDHHGGVPNGPAVESFREHVLDKYFGYRRRYVACVAELAPQRRSLAVASEIARLGFSLAGCLLIASILWLLFAGALERFGTVSFGTAAFALLALVPTLFALLVVRGLAAAVSDR